MDDDFANGLTIGVAIATVIWVACAALLFLCIGVP